MIALFCAGLATFTQLYSPQGLLPAIAGEFDLTAGASSWAIGAATIGVAIGALPWARLSDRIGRVGAMRWAALAAVVVGTTLPFAPDFGSMIAIRLLEGFALAGIPAIAVTALAETIAPRALGAAVGTYIAGTTIGGLLGRILAAETAEALGWRGGLLTVAGFAAVVTVAFAILIPPTAVRPGPVLPVLGALLANLRNPGVMVTVAQAFLLMGGFVAAYNYLAFRLQEPPFGLTLAQVSWIFLAYLAGALSSRWAWRLVPRLPPTGAMLGCIGVMLAGLGLTLLNSLVPVLAGLILFTAGFFGAHAIANGLAARRATAGRSMAPPLYNLGYYAGSSLLGWAGGLAFAAAGWYGTAAMIAVAAVVAGAAAWGYAARRGGLRAADG